MSATQGAKVTIPIFADQEKASITPQVAAIPATATDVTK
jgi:hypothetical protein